MLGDTRNLQNKSRLITRRMFVLSCAKIAIFLALISRLFYLQISENIKYRSLSDKNRLREWKVAPRRGVIEDFFGIKIADNTQVFQLHMMPEDVPNFEELFFRLSKLIDFDDNRKRLLLKRLKKRKPWQPIIISDNLTWAEFSKLNVFLHELQGIKPVVSLARKYFDDGSSSHLIGYVADVSVRDLEKSELLRSINIPGLKTGKNGLEKSFNNLMIGEPGLQRFEVNAFGKRIKELKFIQGKEGKNFRTTIDQEVQKFAGSLIKEKSGSICVMDIFTGDVVAMVSSPTFDANKFVHGISKKDWDSLLSDDKKPLMNKSISGLYPPGSTIKPIVALSALENDVISPKFVVECKGDIELYGQKYHCWKEKGHGFMTLRNAIKQSCDTYFYEIARRLGVDRLSITAKQFGLGEKIFDFLNEEKSGLVPDTKWKINNIGKGWVLGETLITGIGQGYFQTTPVQLCLMTAQLANGGYKIKPRIIDDKDKIQPTLEAWRKEFISRKENPDQREDDFVSSDEFGSDTKYRLRKLYRNPENIKFILDAMYGATNEPMGTSYRSRITKKGYVYAGKTGTSQVRKITESQRKLKLKTEDLPYEQRDHALFIAYAPYKNPRYAISVLIEHGGSGSSGAAPIAKKVIQKVLDRHKLRKKYQVDLYQEI
jgi:penicillin-binding protein 2